jgi:hypothetical protein
MTPEGLEAFRAQLLARDVRVTVGSDLVRAGDAARVLGLAAKTLRNWRADGRGPEYTTIGASVFYPLAALLEFIEAGRDRPARPDTSRHVLDTGGRRTEDDAMHISNARVTTTIPAPVAGSIRQLAKDLGMPTGALIEDALRAYPLIREAMSDDRPDPGGKTT